MNNADLRQRIERLEAENLHMMLMLQSLSDMFGKMLGSQKEILKLDERLATLQAELAQITPASGPSTVN